jgi:arylsulfatase A-like enzyme
VNARNAVECELIDEALGRVLAAIEARGWRDEVDVIFTTDHGELQGDFGLLFKGPYHVDALMRLPLVWRPAPAAAVEPAVVTRAVGLVDLAATFCTIAGVAVPNWVQGAPLPMSEDPAAPVEAVLTAWDSELFGVAVHLRTITRGRWVCTTCLPGTVHDGSEGELYDLEDDPRQQTNLWDDPARRSTRDALLEELRAVAPPARADRLAVEAPV